MPTTTQSPLTFVLWSIHVQHQFVNLVLLHYIDILQREKQNIDDPHGSNNSHLPTTSLFHWWAPGICFSATTQQQSWLLQAIIKQQYFLVPSPRLTEVGHTKSLFCSSDRRHSDRAVRLPCPLPPWLRGGLHCSQPNIEESSHLRPLLLHFKLKVNQHAQITNPFIIQHTMFAIIAKNVPSL